MIQPFLSQDFDKDGVRYGFFGRQGGVSKGVYNSLNARRGSNDNPDAIMENHARIGQYFGSRDRQLNNCYQIHSDIVHVLKGDLNGERPQGDAIVTTKKNIAIGALTADCTPVLFHGLTSNRSPVIGAAHAGWRGAFGGVLNNTVLEMQRLGATNDSITACIGPCIAQKSYEVDQSFYETFQSHDRGNIQFFKTNPDNPTHYLFNLPLYCEHRLAEAGLIKDQILNLNIDTYSNENEFFSYRRTTHQGETEYGGQISVIMIE